MVVFCEGEASEPDYLRGLKALSEVRNGTALDIEIDPRRGVPRTLVRMAVEQDRTAFLDTAAAERPSRRLDGRRGKRIDAERYLPNRGTAVGRAQVLRKKHDEDGTPFPEDNPSSSVSELLRAIEPDLLMDR